MLVLVLAQFPPRLLLTGAVVTALTASAGLVLTFPTAQAPVLPNLDALVPAPASGPAPAAPVPPPAADGAQIAGLAAAPPVAAAPRTRPERARSAAPQPVAPSVAPSPEGLSEADWARLPVGLRERVRTACANGYLTGSHCKHA